MTGHWGLIVAAGASTRMGRDKASLPWGATTLLDYQVQQMHQAGLKPLVVCSARQAMLTLPADVAIAHNPDPERGKTSSILAGLAHLPPDFATLAIIAVDQPRPAWVYTALLQQQQATGALLTAPSYHERLGHPLLVAGALRAELLAIAEDSQGLRQIVRQHLADLLAVPLATSLVCCDLNTPAEYQHWRDRYAEFESRP
ncbi:MAG: nucleotidyltransferase family protein [Spirulinaceae cyanobacterium SM2_1_0]|nr:nucleotidyltransferase family protein [Spirulinaceae cyanobacterium SM2_1_0]